MLITPIMMVLLFSFVFGGSIDIAGSSYREYLVAGAFALNLMFGATYAGIGMADDMQKGIIDRFRSLPMSRAAVVVGRTASNAIGHVLTLAIMALAGLVVGWRVHTSMADVAMGFGLLLLFAYAISWIMVCVALAVPVSRSCKARPAWSSSPSPSSATLSSRSTTSPPPADPG